ncbi:hydroxymethylpyrimidine/phosphomethylpyrimidine kinase [Methanolinea mesophila]|uniref:bifunctional hydroxymethylpyrimidine kinase/phosphomethylpyrimidine kinase n=1 Tax=Methanolinea mesophila TaxID=547055 RepID=UPI001FD82712|nr:bifunctional hydroxymethylpyrimidine kinase/phosphomethylpyrimidine kinase [Methanolinea mesophila]MBP1928233.1 hydroxymethylpyrimidine/phosphomethylpyrimidine kinase [Methanolinea mesophila]
METRTLPVACTIAGSDSGGGAGIQADIKTFAALGVWGVSVLTAVTAQNTREVKGTHLVPSSLVRLQLEAVIEDFPIGAFKTGMLGSGGQVEAVADALPADALLVVDPVMISTSGYPLLDPRGIEALKATLLPRTTVVTPNIPEACLLAGIQRISSMDEARDAASKILALGPEFVIIKGGHMEGDRSSDLLAGEGTEKILSAPRIPCQVHGSGCCFSAALTAYLTSGGGMEDSFRKAKEFVTDAIECAVTSRSGNAMVQPSGHRKK